MFPEWPKGYGWIAPPAQVAKGLGELHWAPGDLVHWVNPVPGGGSPCPRLQRGTAYLSTQSTTVKSDRSQSQHNIFLYKNKFHHRAVEILFPCIDRKLVNHLYSPPTYAIYKNLWPVLQWYILGGIRRDIWQPVFILCQHKFLTLSPPFVLENWYVQEENRFFWQPCVKV